MRLIFSVKIQMYVEKAFKYEISCNLHEQNSDIQSFTKLFTD